MGERLGKTGQNGGTTTQSNAGASAVTNANGAYVRAHLNGLPALPTPTCSFSYRWNSANPGANFSVFLRGFGGWRGKLRPPNGYGVQFTPNSGTVSIKKMVNGSVTNLVSTRGVQTVGTGKQWIRLQVVGSTIRYRLWNDGTPEPGTWVASVTDSSVGASGDAFIALQRTSKATEAKSVTIDDLALMRL